MGGGDNTVVTRSGEVRLTAEGQQKSVERLSRPVREEVTLKPLTTPLILSDEDLQAHIKRVYDDSIAHQTATRDEASKKQSADRDKEVHLTASEPLSAMEEAALVSRVYEEAIANRQTKLDESYERETKSYVRLSNKVSAAKEKEYVDELYRGGMERERNKRIALFNQFVVARRGEPKRISAKRLDEACDRMTKGEIA